ncbi:uncharacterized protein LOC133528697 [Cydia pomonella]|uniref:uncharacterized protein LOC133528697 n=1 Tax=Cydia pomonella TaxID=82600 RepID=UPI002ADE59A1|nr:uncharacterized protein LOC133528697 [Cydia pomonella]
MLIPFVFLCLFTWTVTGASSDCRLRSVHVRQDGGLCFEVLPWQLQPVDLDNHLNHMRQKLRNRTPTEYRKVSPRQALVNSEVSRYVDTVLAPFLDAYHRNIQSSYQQFTAKLLRRIKEEINQAVQKKQKLYDELTKLANELNVPASCDEERRAARTLASQHVSDIHKCVEAARDGIAQMGVYADEMIQITRQHMQAQLNDATRSFNEGTVVIPKGDVPACMQELSRAAANLGYELDLTLTNARRYNEQACEQLSTCSTHAHRASDEAAAKLREQLYQCVYA